MNEQPSLPVLRSAPRQFQTIPVQDDGFAPMMRTGEFAVIDTSNREPELDAFVFVRSALPGCDYSAIVRLYQLSREVYRTPAGIPERRGPLWGTSFGERAMTSLNGKVELVRMGDGPMHDELIREMIVGRGVGVLRPLA